MASSTAGQDATDPAAVMLAYTDAANAQDVEAALACWADDATHTMRPAVINDQSVFTGKAQLRLLAEALATQHCRTELEDLRVDGERVTARTRSTVDSIRQLGIAGLEGAMEAIVRDGKVQSATYSLTAKSAALLSTARSAQSASARIPQAQEIVAGSLTGEADDHVPHQSSG
jgi:hypothetical protein